QRLGEKVGDHPLEDVESSGPGAEGEVLRGDGHRSEGAGGGGGSGDDDAAGGGPTHGRRGGMIGATPRARTGARDRVVPGRLTAGLRPASRDAVASGAVTPRVHRPRTATAQRTATARRVAGASVARGAA